MNDTLSIQEPFLVKNCAIASIALGVQASSLYELHEKLAHVDESCIYYHFWGVKMKPQFVHTQHHNDFSSWAFHRLHDHVLAEKLSIIDPTEFNTIEALRQEVLEIVESRLDDYDIFLYTNKEDRFDFIRSLLIVFESSLTMTKPEELLKIIEILPPSSIFYHFIDARWRTPEKIDDFSTWLKMFGSKYQGLIEEIQAIDPFFLSLTEVKQELMRIAKKNFSRRMI